MPRHQLPATSPIAPSALLRGAQAALGLRDAHAASAAAVAARFGASAVALTDSGTSALVLALRMAAGEGGTVAYPGYACVDLAAAARFARVQVRLYDLDPMTLSPDLDSVRAVLRRGVDAIVVAHLYGFPADVPGVAALADENDVAVIEDAAQSAGGMLAGTRLGGFGALSLLSFGRGKGLTAGGGGALLSIGTQWEQRVETVAAKLGPRARGARELAALTAQWLLGRPSLYDIPASIPGLKLGEMVYHPAHEPERLRDSAAAVLQLAVGRAEAEVEVRRRIAEQVRGVVEDADGLDACRPIPGSVSGYLRFPVLDRRNRTLAPRLGVLRGYPQTLPEQPELRPCLIDGDEPLPGAIELRRSLLTLPTHHMVTRDDVQRLRFWSRSSAPSAGGASRALAAH